MAYFSKLYPYFIIRSLTDEGKYYQKICKLWILPITIELLLLSDNNSVIIIRVGLVPLSKGYEG